MKRQKGFINIPGWFFWLAPIGAILIAVEIVRIIWWLFENVSIGWK